MRTAVISDLHLGTITCADLARDPELCVTLLDELAGADRVVLLGDVLELRHGPPRDAMAAAQPFFEDLGRALAGRELGWQATHGLVEGLAATWTWAKG